MIIGTAGHIDHGKTALVRALTGVDTDRLKEEKARGISIDLGFAYLPAPDGAILGFVDVPGHERFVHNMLAGATGIDFVLLVVAADDGVMPQTREHLAIVDLLGIAHGVVALTKTDLVDAGAARRGRAARSRKRSPAPALAGAEIVPVSTVTGEGIDALREHLFDGRAHVGRPRRERGRFRLAVDRSFTLPGAGTVVTGTVLSGACRVGDRVIVSPSRTAARVRSIHAQNRAARARRAGERCALNLAGDGIAKDAIARGDVVLDPDLHAPTDRIDATLRVLAPRAKPVAQWMPVRLHHAARRGRRAHRAARRRSRSRRASEAFVQLVLERPIAAAVRRPLRAARHHRAAHDRRRALPRSARAGAQAPHARAARAARRARARRSRSSAGRAARPAAVLSSISPPSRATARSPRPRSTTWLQRHRRLRSGAGAHARAVAGDWQRLKRGLLATLETFHAANPDLPGIGLERLRLQLEPRLPAPAFWRVLQGLRASRRDRARRRLGAAARPRGAADAGGREALGAGSRRCSAATERFRPPRVRDIAELLGAPEAEVRRLLKLLGRMGKVDEVAHDHFFLRDTVAEMVDDHRRRRGRPRDGRVHRRAVPRPARQRPQGRDPDPGILRPPRRHLAPRRPAPHQPASARSVSRRRRRRADAAASLEENRPRWGVRTSNPGGAASRSLVGSNSLSLPPPSRQRSGRAR